MGRTGLNSPRDRRMYRNPDPASRQRRGEPPGPARELRVAEHAVIVDDGRLPRVDRGRALEEPGRCQRNVIGRAPPKPVLQRACSRRVVERPVSRPGRHTSRIAPSSPAGKVAFARGRTISSVGSGSGRQPATTSPARQRAPCRSGRDHRPGLATGQRHPSERRETIPPARTAAPSGTVRSRQASPSSRQNSSKSAGSGQSVHRWSAERAGSSTESRYTRYLMGT
jgi:hypothetical protein